MRKGKEFRRRLRRPFETAGYTLLTWTIPLLPRAMVVALSKGAGHLALWLPTRERRVGFINLDAVYGDSITPARKREILRSSFGTFALTMLDLFWFARNPEKRILKYVDFPDTPNKTAMFADAPRICVTAHLGSWEVMGQTMSLLGLDLASIAATVKNPAVDRLLIAQRERTGQTIIAQRGALRTLIGRFRKNGKAAFVLDQNTNPVDGGIAVNFLGLPMSVSPAPAALAYRTGTEIHLGFCRPKPNGRYEIELPKIIIPPPFDKNRDIDEATLELTQIVEDAVSEQILRTPEFWLWSYKHWRREEGREYPANFPNY